MGWRGEAGTDPRSRRAPARAALLALALVLALTGTPASGQAPPSPERLTRDLVSLTARYRAASPSDQPRLLGDLLALGASRHALLAALVETDPGAVLRLAVPARVRADMPRELLAYVEEEVQVEGELEVLHEDRHSGSRYLYFLNTSVERLSLHFAADPPDLLTGARVRVRGVRVGHALAVASGR